MMNLGDSRSNSEWCREAIRNINNQDPSVSAWAMKTLDNPPLPLEVDIVPELIATLSSSHFVAHHSITAILRTFGPAAEPAIPALIRLLRNKTELIFRPETTADISAQGAMEALAAIGEASVSILAQELRDPDVQIRIVSTWALGTVGRTTSAACTPLIEALRDANDWVRAQAAHQLGECRVNADDAIARLLHCLRDESVFVRAEATHALAKVKPGFTPDYSEIIDDLSSALFHSEETIRAKAAHTVQHLGKEAHAVVPSLIAVLERYEPPLTEAVTALSEICGADHSFIPALVEIVATRDDTLSAEIAMALIGIGPPAKSVVPHLIARMKTAWSGRQCAIFGFAALEAEPEEVIPLLTEIVLWGLDPPDTVPDLHRIGAINTLAKLGGDYRHCVVPVLIRAAHDPVADVRSAAAFALGKLAMT